MTIVLISWPHIFPLASVAKVHYTFIYQREMFGYVLTKGSTNQSYNKYAIQ